MNTTIDTNTTETAAPASSASTAVTSARPAYRPMTRDEANDFISENPLSTPSSGPTRAAMSMTTSSRLPPLDFTRASCPMTPPSG